MGRNTTATLPTKSLDSISNSNSEEITAIIGQAITTTDQEKGEEPAAQQEVDDDEPKVADMEEIPLVDVVQPMEWTGEDSVQENPQQQQQPNISFTLPHIVEEPEEDEEEEEEDEPLPRPGSLSNVGRLKPPTTRHLFSVEEEDDEDSPPSSPDLNYSLKGDENEDRKYYIYKVRDVNMVPHKECLGRVVVPGEMVAKSKSKSVTLEDLRKLIRQSSDEMLRDAAKQRFRYLSESYHLVAGEEGYTAVDELYPTQGVFIKLDNEHPFTRRRVDNSLTARLQAEYEKRFGPISPRRPPRPSLIAGLQPDTEKDESDYDPNVWDPNRVTAKLTGGRRVRASNQSVYKSMDCVDGQYRDKRNHKSQAEAEPWQPRAKGTKKGKRKAPVIAATSNLTRSPFRSSLEILIMDCKIVQTANSDASVFCTFFVKNKFNDIIIQHNLTI